MSETPHSFACPYLRDVYIEDYSVSSLAKEETLSRHYPEHFLCARNYVIVAGL